jgi:excisionase family DNA binding protein
MQHLTFEQLPDAVALLLEKVSDLEKLLTKDRLQEDAQDEVMNIAQAAKFLELSVPTIYTKVSRREIPVNKPGGKRLYFSKTELIRWIRGGRQKTAAEQFDPAMHLEGGFMRQRKRSANRSH